MIDYKVGQEPIYHEGGKVLKVRVLAADGDRIIERYRLKVLGIIKESEVLAQSKVGKEFSCEKRRDGKDDGLWHLLNV